MFDNKRYITRGVQAEIPFALQLFMWECVYTDEEELLIDMCNCFGVDEEDVLLLIDYGYTAVEIEEMFIDTDLLRTTIHEIKHSSFYNDFKSEV